MCFLTLGNSNVEKKIKHKQNLENFCIYTLKY